MQPYRAKLPGRWRQVANATEARSGAYPSPSRTSRDRSHVGSAGRG